jgi:hypothetical protein
MALCRLGCPYLVALDCSLAKEGLATWLVSLAELGVEMPWLGMSPWLALLSSVVVWIHFGSWGLVEALVIQQVPCLEVACYGCLAPPWLESVGSTPWLGR